MPRWLRDIILFAPSLGFATPLFADPLIGNAGAAYSTAESVGVNPANAGFIDRSQISYEPTLFSQSSLQIHYRDFPPVAKDDNSPELLAMPGLVFKPTSRLGFGGLIAPPGLSQKVSAQGIPFILFGQQNSLDIRGTGKVDAFAQLRAGYRLSDRLGLGVKFDYVAIQADISVIPTEGGGELASVHLVQQSMNVGFGMRFEVLPGRFSLGIAVDIVGQNKRKVDTTVLGSTGEDGASDTESAASDCTAGGEVQTTTFSAATIGVQVMPMARFRILSDLVYQRTPKSMSTSMSLVDLKCKTEDVHDTLGIRTGVVVGITDSANFLAGVSYDPASKGPGSPGEDGQIGFGPLDLFLIFAGQGKLKPLLSIGSGVQMGFSPHTAGSSKRGNTLSGYYAWTVAAGLVHERASLGIDEKGELPGAYLYTHTYLPVAITYKF